MKISSKEVGICVKSSYPKFKYRFPKADVLIDVDDAHVEKILKNPTFYKAETTTKTKVLSKPESK